MLIRWAIKYMQRSMKRYRMLLSTLIVTIVVSTFYMVVLSGNHNKSFPVDLVYTWVNGSDPEFMQEKAWWLNRFDKLDASGTISAKFVEHEELKYSLRSVRKNLPWINHIYIITNGQIPSWLDRTNRWISIITHNQIMPDSSLPTFNSEAIEANIHHIPNLSEHFIYSNDDYYFYRPLSKSFFFTKQGNPLVIKGNLYFSDSVYNNGSNMLYINNVVYGLKLLEKQYGMLIRFEVSHTQEAHKKSHFLTCESLFPEQFNYTTHNKFRAPRSVHHSMMSYYSLIIGDGYVAPDKSPNFPNQKYMVVQSVEKMKEILRKVKPAQLCINDVGQVSENDYLTYPSFLESVWPDKGAWEL